jgi:hypothetical protein
VVVLGSRPDIFAGKSTVYGDDEAAKRAKEAGKEEAIC